MNIAGTQHSRAWLLGLLALLAWVGTLGVTLVQPTARELLRQPMHVLGFSPDGSTLVRLNRAEGTVTLVDVATGTPKIDLQAKGAMMTRSAFSLDGKTVALCCAAFGIRVFDTATGKERVAIPLQNFGAMLAVSQNGERVAVSQPDEGGDVISIWDTRNGMEVGMFGRGDFHKLGFSANGRLLAAGTTNGSAKTGEGTIATVWPAVHRGGEYDQLTFSADGLWLVELEPNGTATILDLATNIQRVLPNKLEVSDLNSLSPNRTMLAIGAQTDAGNRTLVLDTATGRTLADLPFCTHCAFWPDGKTLVTYDQQALTLWTMPPRIPQSVRWGLGAAAIALSLICWYVARRREGQPPPS